MGVLVDLEKEYGSDYDLFSVLDKFYEKVNVDENNLDIGDKRDLIGLSIVSKGNKGTYTENFELGNISETELEYVKNYTFFSRYIKNGNYCLMETSEGEKLNNSGRSNLYSFKFIDRATETKKINKRKYLANLFKEGVSFAGLDISLNYPSEKQENTVRYQLASEFLKYAIEDAIKNNFQNNYYLDMHSFLHEDQVDLLLGEYIFELTDNQKTNIKRMFEYNKTVFNRSIYMLEFIEFLIISKGKKHFKKYIHSESKINSNELMSLNVDMQFESANDKKPSTKRNEIDKGDKISKQISFAEFMHWELTVQYNQYSEPYNEFSKYGAQNVIDFRISRDNNGNPITEKLESIDLRAEKHSLEKIYRKMTRVLSDEEKINTSDPIDIKNKLFGYIKSLPIVDAKLDKIVELFNSGEYQKSLSMVVQDITPKINTHILRLERKYKMRTILKNSYVLSRLKMKSDNERMVVHYMAHIPVSDANEDDMRKQELKARNEKRNDFIQSLLDKDELTNEDVFYLYGVQVGLLMTGTSNKITFFKSAARINKLSEIKRFAAKRTEINFNDAYYRNLLVGVFQKLQQVNVENKTLSVDEKYSYLSGLVSFY